MSEDELREPPYKSYWRDRDMAWGDPRQPDPYNPGRDLLGRFLPKWSGEVCDWIGCTDRLEAPGRRFCAAHRRAHGERLVGQLHAAVAEHGRRRAQVAHLMSNGGEKP